MANLDSCPVERVRKPCSISVSVGPSAEPAGCPIVSWEGGGSTWGKVYREDHAYLLHFNKTCQAKIAHDTGDITLRIESERAREDALHHLSNAIMPFSRSCRGEAVFHGSAVEFDGKSAVFLGLTGAGKSTLAAFLGRKGYPVLADDILVARHLKPLVIEPQQSAIRLWQSSLDGLAVPEEDTEQIRATSSKRGLGVNGQITFSENACEVRAAFVLSTADAPDLRVQRRKGHAAFNAWQKNMFILDPTMEIYGNKLLDNVALISGTIPTYDLSYPKRFSALDDVRHIIVDLL